MRDYGTVIPAEKEKRGLLVTPAYANSPPPRKGLKARSALHSRCLYEVVMERDRATDHPSLSRTEASMPAAAECAVRWVVDLASRRVVPRHTEDGTPQPAGRYLVSNR